MRFAWPLFPILVMFIVCTAAAQAKDKQKFYISLDTNPNHFRNVVVADFVHRLRDSVGEALDIQVFHSGQLYKGRDELKGLAWGNIQMAVPGTLSLSRFEADLNLFTLPAFYGLPYRIMRPLVEGRTVQLLNNRIEKNLPVKVIGRYLELGYLHTFTKEQPIQTVSGYSGLKIRTPGGSADITRYKLLNANPVALPFSDVPLALSQGAVDGVSSSYETVKSGVLWEVGLRYAFEDRGAYFQYLPLVSRPFWDIAPLHIRRAIKQAWAQASEKGQHFAEQRQKQAKSAFMSHGGKVVIPLQSALESQRQAMIPSTPDLVEHLDMDPQLVQMALEEVEELLTRQISSDKPNTRPNTRPDTRPDTRKDFP